MADPIKAVKITADAYKKAAENAFKKFSDDCASSQNIQDGDPSKCDLTQYAKDTTEDLTEAMKEHIKNAMTAAGATAEEAEEWLESHSEDVWAKCEEIRNSSATQKMAKNVGKWAHGLKVGLVAAVAGCLAIVFTARKIDNARHGDGQTAVSNTLEYYDQTQQFHDRMNQYNAIMSSLQEPMGSAPEQPQAQAALEPMPQAVAAVAAAPMAVIIPRPVDPAVGGAPENQTVQSTVGQVWRTFPDSHEPIERGATNTGYTPGWAEKTERWPGDYAAHAGEGGGSSGGGTLKVNATVMSPWGATVHIESH